MNELTKRNQTELAKAGGRGFEQPIQREDIIIPRAKLVQAMSEETQQNILPGKIINSLTKEELPSSFVPIFFFTEWIRFNPRDAKAPGFDQNFGPGDLIYRTQDPGDERLKVDGVWSGDIPPFATKFLNFFSVFEGVHMPIIVSFCNTSFKTGRQLLSLARFGGGDMFSKKYALTSERKQNDKGTFYITKVALAGVPTDEEYKFAESLYEDFRGKEIQADVAEPF